MIHRLNLPLDADELKALFTEDNPMRVLLERVLNRAQSQPECPRSRTVVPLRWVLVRNPTGRLAPAALLSTNLTLTAAEILTYFVQRWTVEVTFEEVRRHLGVETQRQWSDRAIRRTTPILLGTFSLVTLLAHRLVAEDCLTVRQAAWYSKAWPTFSDAIAAVRQQFWQVRYLSMSVPEADLVKIPRPVWST